MFDRFTDHGTRAMTEASRHAVRLNHEYLGSEHMLLGLIEVDGCHARAILESLRVPPERVRAEMDRLLMPGPSLEPMPQMPFTLRAKKVLEYSMEEAGLLRSTVIGTEHILLGLVRDTEGVAGQVLSACGVWLDKARELARQQSDPEDASRRMGRNPSGDHRSEAWRLRVLEEAADVLADLQESELGARVREVALKHGSRKWEQ